MSNSEGGCVDADGASSGVSKAGEDRSGTGVGRRKGSGGVAAVFDKAKLRVAKEEVVAVWLTALTKAPSAASTPPTNGPPAPTRAASGSSITPLAATTSAPAMADGGAVWADCAGEDGRRFAPLRPTDGDPISTADSFSAKERGRAVCGALPSNTDGVQLAWRAVDVEAPTGEGVGGSGDLGRR